MDSSRRSFVRYAGSTGILALLVASGFIRVARAGSDLWDKEAFEATTLEEAIAKVTDLTVVESREIDIVAPEIAENGAVVPVGVVATMSDVQSIAILCERNPHPLAAIYDVPSGTFADVKTRVKMAETSRVVVLVKAAGKFHTASKEIKVTRGGCGG